MLFQFQGNGPGDVHIPSFLSNLHPSGFVCQRGFTQLWLDATVRRQGADSIARRLTVGVKCCHRARAVAEAQIRNNLQFLGKNTGGACRRWHDNPGPAVLFWFALRLQIMALGVLERLRTDSPTQGLRVCRRQRQRERLCIGPGLSL